MMPQEIQVWYIIPALRKEFAKCLVKEYGFTQKDAARMLGVTEAAISQYFGSKRGSEVVFNKKIIEKIRNSCSRILDGTSTLQEELYGISMSEGVKDVMCRIHKDKDSEVAERCNICFK